MLDDNWELINGPAAHHIEQLNATNTINVIEALVTFLNHIRATQGNPAQMLSQTAFRELHRTGTIFLLGSPGEYRKEPVVVRAGAQVVYDPPKWEEVPAYMDQMFAELSAIWVAGDALDVAAFALWRVNWVHPFKNGNGRTARSFAYACLCAKLEVMLPGTTTVIDQIMVTRVEYEAALREGDKAAAQNNGRNLKPMRDYLNRLLQIQMNSIQP